MEIVYCESKVFSRFLLVVFWVNDLNVKYEEKVTIQFSDIYKFIIVIVVFYEDVVKYKMQLFIGHHGYGPR